MLDQLPSLCIFSFYVQTHHISPSASCLSIYLTFSLSLKPPPYHVLSSNLAYLGVLYMLHYDLLTQFTLLQVLHSQSLAPGFFCSVFPIWGPPISIILVSVVFSWPHLLQLVFLAEFSFPHFLSGQIQSLSLMQSIS